MKVQKTSNTKPGLNKDQKQTVRILENTNDRLLKPNARKKRRTGPGLYVMIMIWILIILLGAAIFLRLRHYIIAHW